MPLQRQDLDRLINPLESLRASVEQIGNLLTGSGGFQKSLRDTFSGFDKSTTIMKSVIDRLGKGMGAGGRKQLKELAQGIQGVLMQKFSKENTKKKYFDKFAGEFGKAFQPKLLQSLRTAFTKGVKKGDWQAFYTLFQKGMAQAIQVGITIPKEAGRGLMNVAKDFGDGLKSTLNKQLGFLPDFLRRPLTKGIGKAIDGRSQGMSKMAMNNKFIRGSFQKITGFASKFGVQIAIAAAIVGGIVKLFQQMQGAWARINKQFGGLILSFDEMRAQSRKFTMQTGLGMQKFKESTIAVVKQFGFFDARAVKTTGMLNRVFGVTFDERSKVQRIVGGPGKSIKSSLDYVTKQTIMYGGHGRQVFKDIIRMGDKFRTLTDDQRKGFIRMSAQLSSMGVTGTTVFQNLEKGFGSIGTALDTTKKVNLRILQMGYNSGKTYKMLSATRSIDIYKRTRIGDTQKAFQILSKNVGTDMIKDFDNIKSQAAKQDFLQAMFGDVEQGRKIMDSMRNMLDTFGTTDIKKLQQRFTGAFSGEMATQKTQALVDKIKKMSMDSSEEVRRNAKKIFDGRRPQLLEKLKVQVGTKVQTVKTFEDMAKATTTLGDSFGRMWQAFKRGFIKSLLPVFQRINKAFGGARTTQWARFFGLLGQGLGKIITVLPSLLALVNVVAKVAGWFVILSEIFGAFKIAGFITGISEFFSGIIKWGAAAIKTASAFSPILETLFKLGAWRLKWLQPIGWIVVAIQTLYGVFKNFKSTGSIFLNIIQAIVLTILSAIDVLTFGFFKLAKTGGEAFAQKGNTPTPGGRQAAAGDYVIATPGGVQRTVGQGGKDQIISPVNDMQAMADRARVKASGGSNPQLITILKQQNRLLKTMVQKLSSPLKLTDRSGGLPRLKIQGDIAHIVSGQLRYRMK